MFRPLHAKKVHCTAWFFWMAHCWFQDQRSSSYGACRYCGIIQRTCFLRKAFTNNHHPLFLVRGYKPYAFCLIQRLILWHVLAWISLLQPIGSEENWPEHKRFNCSDFVESLRCYLLRFRFQVGEIRSSPVFTDGRRAFLLLRSWQSTCWHSASKMIYMDVQVGFQAYKRPLD